MSESKTTHSGGVGFAGLLTIVFIALKLMGYIKWSWWWVLAPSWIPLAIAIAIAGILVLLAVIDDLKP